MDINTMGGVAGGAPVSGGGSSPLPDRVKPAGNDVDAFQQAMNAPAEAAAPRTPADGVVEELGGLSDRIQAGREHVAGVLAKPDVTQAELLGAQLSMMESSTLVTAASKVSEKITQAVKTLQQG